MIEWTDCSRSPESAVFPQKFGYGTVTAVENDRLDATFEQAGEKRVLDRYVEIA
jgi:DNA helicase-2/ATP-dependent DNA helicase PcrA